MRTHVLAVLWLMYLGGVCSKADGQTEGQEQCVQPPDKGDLDDLDLTQRQLASFIDQQCPANSSSISQFNPFCPCRDHDDHWRRCSAKGGICMPTWLAELIGCDYQLSGKCHPGSKSCTCCIHCRWGCSACKRDDYANCRKKCYQHEFSEFSKKCHSPYCRCCKECQIEPECRDTKGYCVGSPIYCTQEGYYASKCGCKGRRCYCCRPAGPCEKLPECNGYCTASKTCGIGYKLSETGCLGPNCRCCQKMWLDQVVDPIGVAQGPKDLAPGESKDL